jgi:hypothetical protein
MLFFPISAHLCVLMVTRGVLIPPPEQKPGLRFFAFFYNEDLPSPPLTSNPTQGGRVRSL